MADNREFVLSAIIQVLDKATAPLQRIGRGFDRMSINLSKTAANMYSVADNMKKFGNAMNGYGRDLTMGLTLPIIGLGAVSLKTFGEFEMMTANFTTMFGGNEKAAKSFLKVIENYADVTPYTTAGLAKNAQTMMQFGVNSEKVMPVLQQLGDIAGGNTERMDRLALAFAQVSSMGRLQGQDLLQMVNAGFNPLQIISQKTGKSLAELKDIMSAGGISAEAVAEAFRIATSEGGLFYKGAERGSKTLFGLFSTLKDTGEKSLRLLGETLKDSLNLSEEIPKLTERISKMTKGLAEWIKENPELTKFLIKFLLISAALGPVVVVFGKIVSTLSVLVRGVGLATKGLAGFFKLLGLLKGVNLGAGFTGAGSLIATMGAIAAAVAVVTGAAYGLSKALDVLEAKLGKWSTGARQSFWNIPVVGAMMQGMDLWKGKTNDPTYNNLMSIRKQAEEVLKTSKNPEVLKKAKELLSQTEIYIKVAAEPGSSASVDQIKSTGDNKPNVSSQGSMGNILQFEYP